MTCAKTCKTCKYWGVNFAKTNFKDIPEEESVIDIVNDQRISSCFWITGEWVGVVTGRSPDDSFGPAGLDWKSALATMETFGCNQHESI